jgi:hypothetical protein
MEKLNPGVMNYGNEKNSTGKKEDKKETRAT